MPARPYSTDSREEQVRTACGTRKGLAANDSLTCQYGAGARESAPASMVHGHVKGPVLLKPSRWLQAISFGLTQYDVEELMEYSGHKCIAWRNECCVDSPTSTSSPAFLAVTQAEIEGLYKRFRALDRGRKVLHCA